MTSPVIAALEHCLRLLGECKEGSASMIVPTGQLGLMKPRTIKNRVLHNLSHQLAGLITKEAEIDKSIVYTQQPDLSKGDNTRFTLRTVVMKASAYVDLQTGLNSLLMAALDEEQGHKSVTESLVGKNSEDKIDGPGRRYDIG